MVAFELSCPTCESILEIHEGEPNCTCSTCGHVFSASNGIVDFIPEKNFYWGEIKEDLMKEINEQAEKDNWFKALTENLTGKYEVYLDYILDPVRYASIFHFYDEAHVDTCLDLGSGWGPISFGLSKYFKKVYSVDGVYERLRFQSIRARQSSIENIKFLRSTMLRLPIPDNTVDVAIVNGLLEWIGLSAADISPADLQKRFLKEVMRVLKPHGRLMIGIENRFGLQYFHGTRDHSGLRFTSLMPRRLANWVVKKFKRGEDALVYSGAEDSYRTLTHSYWGYENLLRKAGFQNPDIYWSWPTYNYPHVTGTTDGESIRYYLETLMDSSNNGLYRTAIQVAHHGSDSLMKSVIKMFSPHFLIVANKGETAEKFQDKFVKNDSTSFIRMTQEKQPDFASTYYCLQGGKLSKIIGVKEDSTSNGHKKFTTRELVGVPGRLLHHTSMADVRLAANWLAEFHDGSTQGIWRPDELVAEMETLSRKIYLIFPEDLELHNLIRSYLVKYAEAVSSIPVPRVTEQGNFTLSNMLVDDSGHLNVIEWENSMPGGNPMMDIGAFYISLLRRNNKIQDNVFSSSKITEMSEFAIAYQGNTPVRLPVRLAPAYYVLRLVWRAVKDQGLNSENYMYIKTWLKYLLPSINLVVENKDVEEAH